MDRERRNRLKEECAAQKAARSLSLTAQPESSFIELAQPQETPMMPPDPSKPVKGGNGSVQQMYSCGHGWQVKELSKQPCPSCRNKAREESNRKWRAKKDEKKAAKSALYHIPVGSCHESHKVAEGRYEGELRVPHNGAFVRFTGEGPGLASLEHSLFAQYQEWLAKQAGTVYSDSGNEKRPSSPLGT